VAHRAHRIGLGDRCESPDGLWEEKGMEQRHGAIKPRLSGRIAGGRKMDRPQLFGLSGFLLRRRRKNPERGDEGHEQ
jgi:hypothetical protein